MHKVKSRSKPFQVILRYLTNKSLRQRVVWMTRKICMCYCTLHPCRSNVRSHFIGNFVIARAHVYKIEMTRDRTAVTAILCYKEGGKSEERRAKRWMDGWYQGGPEKRKSET